MYYTWVETGAGSGLDNRNGSIHYYILLLLLLLLYTCTYYYLYNTALHTHTQISNIILYTASYIIYVYAHNGHDAILFYIKCIYIYNIIAFRIGYIVITNACFLSLFLYVNICYYIIYIYMCVCV